MQSKRNQSNNKIFLPWILFIQSNLFLQRTCLFIRVSLNIIWKIYINKHFIYYINVYREKNGCFSLLLVNFSISKVAFKSGCWRVFCVSDWCCCCRRKKKKKEQATPYNTCSLSILFLFLTPSLFSLHPSPILGTTVVLMTQILVKLTNHQREWKRYNSNYHKQIYLQRYQETFPIKSISIYLYFTCMDCSNHGSEF